MLLLFNVNHVRHDVLLLSYQIFMYLCYRVLSYHVTGIPVLHLMETITKEIHFEIFNVMSFKDYLKPISLLINNSYNVKKMR